MKNENDKKIDKKKRTMKKDLVAGIGGLMGFLYVLNPGAGIFEILPDALPIVGNLDEAGAVLLVIGSLRYFGLDLSRFLSK